MVNALRLSYPRLISGGIMVGVGILLLLANTRLLQAFPVASFWDLWPSLFTVLGLYRLAEATTPDHRREAGWLIIFGLWLQVSYSHLFGWGFGTTWPMLVIGIGINILWKSILTNHPTTERTDNGH